MRGWSTLRNDCAGRARIDQRRGDAERNGDPEPGQRVIPLHDLQRERATRTVTTARWKAPPSATLTSPASHSTPQEHERRDEDQGQREGDDDSAARPMCGEELGMGPEEIEERLCDRERPERPEMRTPLENLPSPRRRSRSQVDTPPRLPTTAGHRGDASETNPIPRMTPTHCRIRPSDPNRGVSFLRSGRAARRGL